MSRTMLVVAGVVILLGYRWVRNRPRRLLRWFAGRVRKMPEVRIIARRDRQVTVVVDRAVANTYVRITAAMDRINRKRFFGEPYTVVVRDDVAGPELRGLLQGNVLYVRKDVLEQEV